MTSRLFAAPCWYLYSRADNDGLNPRVQTFFFFNLEFCILERFFFFFLSVFVYFFFFIVFLWRLLTRVQSEGEGRGRSWAACCPLLGSWRYSGDGMDNKLEATKIHSWEISSVFLHISSAGAFRFVYVGNALMVTPAGSLGGSVIVRQSRNSTVGVHIFFFNALCCKILSMTNVSGV